MLKKLIDKISRIFDILGMIIFLTMFVSITLQIIGRNFLHIPMPWTEELSRILYTWLVFLGAIFITKNEENIKIEILFDYLPSYAKKIFDAITHILIIVFSIVAIQGGIILVKLNINAYTSSLPRFITYAKIYFIIPFSFSFIALFSILKLIDMIKETFFSKKKLKKKFSNV